MKLNKVDEKTAYENLLVKYAELENKIADIKANCDLAIEGRDVKIMELEQELTVEKDLLQEETNLHLHAEDYIKSLEKENEELRNNGFTVSAMTEQQLKVAIEKGEQLEKENAELKAQIKLLGERCNQLLKDKGDLTDKIADIKANCDFALEGKDIEIKELKEKHESSISQWKYELNKLIHNEVELSKENRTLEGCLLAEQEHTQMLEQQIEKMKRHCNCKHRDDEGYCEVKRTYLMDLSYDGCDKWELED